VLGFRYDLETQLELVRLHVHDFRFAAGACGLSASAAASVLGILDTVRVDARAIRVRTFCQPDTVIAKQLLDAQGLFNVLAVSETMHRHVAEIISFFKAAVERERHFARVATEKAEEDASVGRAV
jgi:hypothetical protein